MNDPAHQLPDPATLPPFARGMLELREAVLAEWEARVRDSLQSARNIRHPVMIDTMPYFYLDLVHALTPGHARGDAITGSTRASEHGGERARLTQFDPDMLILEYQLFRQAIFDVLRRHGLRPDEAEEATIDNAIDTAIREAVTSFTLVLADLREQFVAALTHDMRTPLGAAMIAAELIGKRTQAPRDADLARRIVVHLRRVDDMISGLLDTMQHQHGERPHLSLSTFDVAELAREVIQQSAAQHGERFVLEGGAVGCWDREALKRALENLVGNALKYGRPGTPVHVGIEEQHERLYLSVHNVGDAIPADEQEAIFQIFRRASKDREGAKRGWGVGLPFVRTVAESHGGSVTVDSGAGGTTFAIDIPLDARPYLDAPAS